MGVMRSVPYPFCDCRTCTKRDTCNTDEVVKKLQEINCVIETLQCDVSSIGNELCTTNENLKVVRQSLNTQFSVVAKVEYPEEVDGMLVYKWLGYTFRDWVLGPLDIYFSGSIGVDLPVYIQDESGYKHIVNAPGSTEQLVGVSATLVDKLLPAVYSGNYINLQ